MRYLSIFMHTESLLHCVQLSLSGYNTAPYYQPAGSGGVCAIGAAAAAAAATPSSLLYLTTTDSMTLSR